MGVGSAQIKKEECECSKKKYLLLDFFVLRRIKIEKVQETHLYKCLKEKDSKFINQLDEVIKYAETMLPKINIVFASYTNHGIGHSILHDADGIVHNCLKHDDDYG